VKSYFIVAKINDRVQIRAFVLSASIAEYFPTGNCSLTQISSL